MKPPLRRCAIYTRKSTEEGLEQDFNSLDAQREACHSYILSQKAESWMALKDHYDDGGFSGGNMDRPALKKLMSDIEAGKVHIVVVYKIDRLTRSLMDFARLVDVFDKHGVTFVSITQSFNTTTSMGRLTLNVLLSFAQFEREVTGERIRDKVAASRKKGMWMGGSVPLGYKVRDKALLIHEEHAVLVKRIFHAYEEMGSFLKLQAYLEKGGYKTQNGYLFNRGGLHALLTNPIYIGKVRHRKQVYDGLHQAIISQELWDAVQKKLGGSPKEREVKSVSQGFLLQGLLYDESGSLYAPVFTDKSQQLYRYYVSRSKSGKRVVPEASRERLPAQEIETFVEKALRCHIEDPQKLAEMLSMDHALDHALLQNLSSECIRTDTDIVIRKAIRKIIIRYDHLEMHISRSGLLSLLQQGDNEMAEEIYTLKTPFRIKRALKGTLIIRPPATRTPEDIFSLPPHKLKNLVRGIVWRDEHFRGTSILAIARRENCDGSFVGRMIRHTFDIA